MTALLDHYRLARLLLDRRDFLRAMGLLGSAAGIASLPGCGDGWGDSAASAGGATQTYRVNGRVETPTGFSLLRTQLSVMSGASVAIPSASGEFNVSTNTQEPSLAVLIGQSGNSVFLSFLDPQFGQNIIDATSTAVALLYFAIGGPTVPPSDKREILQLLAVDPIVSPLASVIAARVAAHPYQIQAGDAQISAALLTAYSTLTANVLAAATGVQSAAHVREAALKVTASASVTPLELVQPSGQQSGVEVVQPADVVGVQAINHYRRRAQLYVYRVSEVSTAGVSTTYPAALAVGNRVDISATAALGLFTTLDNLFSGATAFMPVTSPVQAVSMQPNASRTNFEVVVLGASGSSNPAFFSDAKYAAVSPAWITSVGDLNLFTAIGDMALGFILELWGLRFVITDAAPIQAVLDGLAGLQATVPTVADLLARARAGKYSQAISDVIELAANSDIVSNTIKQALKPYIVQLEHEFAVGARASISSRLMSSAFRLISAAFTPVAMTMGLGDLAAIAYDLANSNPGDLWTVNLTTPTITLSPTTATISAGGRVTFSVRLSTGTTGNFVFDWSQTSPYGTLSASNGTVGNSLETDDASITVDLVTTPSDTQPITVTVTAFEVDSSGAKLQFGVATAKVTVSQGAVIQCGTRGPFEKIYPDGRFTWISMFTFAQVPGATHYAFSGYLTGTVTLADPNESVPVIDQGTYTDPDFTTWVAYQSAGGSGSGLAIYNLGGGLMGVVAYPGPAPQLYSILTYKTEAEAIEIANDTEFGLIAYVSSADPERATRVARKLAAGRVLINTLSHDPFAPFGGFKQSGIGREGGIFGLQEYLEPKAIIG